MNTATKARKTHVWEVTIWILTPRPSCPPASYILAGNEPGGGGQDFAWLVFNKLATIDAPRVKWLHRDGGVS